MIDFDLVVAIIGGASVVSLVALIIAFELGAIR